jgi:aminoglycoside phosphotransferase (APT) family kinase protein
MGSSFTGDPLWGVLIPPELNRFKAVVGIHDDATLHVDYTGWNKYVILVDDLAFLFPRRAVNVEWLERELAAYRALQPIELAVVPPLLGEWREDLVYPFPFAAVQRLPGELPTDASLLFDQLGRAIAQWHQIIPPNLPGARPPEHHDRAHMGWLRRALDPTTTHDAVEEAAQRLGRRDRLARWTELLDAAARLQHVLVHGDIHEGQMLAIDGELTGILDWETARVDHPFWDFDLGEWGTGLWRRHRCDFSRLWASAWRSYALERELDTDASPLETAFRLRQALYLLENDRDPDVVGTMEEHLEAI